MSRYQLLLLPLLAGAVFFLAGSVEPTAAPALSIPSAVVHNPANPWQGEARPIPANLAQAKPAELLARAAAQFGPDQIQWLDVTIRQHVAYDEIGFELDGRYLCAPGQRFRYDLKVKIGAAASRFLTICDGVHMAELTELPGKPPQVSATLLPRIQRPTDDPAEVAAARQTLVQSKSFAGLTQLLASLQVGLGAPEMRLVQVQGKELLEIKGKWVMQKAQERTDPDDIRLRAIARECRVFLDPATLWPRCIEWWGGMSENQPPQLLMQIVYDLTRWNQPLTAEEVAREFATTATR
jgi:hypothetical protein